MEVVSEWKVPFAHTEKDACTNQRAEAFESADFWILLPRCSKLDQRAELKVFRARASPTCSLSSLASLPYLLRIHSPLLVIDLRIMAATSRSTAPARSDRDRLRDYYGLAGPDDQAASSSAAASSSSSPSLGPTSAPSKPSRDALPTSIPSLLRSHASLLTSMRELDGERQSLVYNHHGDLVAASQTISKMKEQSDQLTATLQGLQRGLEGMGKWEGQLAGMKSVGGVRKGRQEMGVDIEKDVAPIVTLPERLRDAAALRAASEGRDEEAAESARGLEQGELACAVSGSPVRARKV